MSFKAAAGAIAPELQQLRRTLHRIPEIGLLLPRTQAVVLEAIKDLGLEVTTGQNLSSVTAVLRGNGSGGPVVLLRGDMDALPVVEESDEEYVSEHLGAMHACGHDLHTAGLVGAAKLLSARRDELSGDVVFMFQPGEEGHDGAAHMIEEGVLEVAGRPVDAAYGLHVMSAMLPTGVFSGRPDRLMAASDGLFVQVEGVGGHGSRPMETLDPIPVAAQMVTALQNLVTRRFDVFDPVVLTVGSFHSGTRRNVIPDDATFEATVRTFSAQARDRMAELAPKLCRDIASANGLVANVQYEREYPATINNPTEYAFVADTVRDIFGEKRYEPLAHPIMGSEDFSRVLNRVPGAYIFLGASKSEDASLAPANHSPRAAFDDAVVADGAALLAELAVRRMNRS